MAMNRRVTVSIITLIVIVFTAIGAYGAVWAVSAFLDRQYASLHGGCYPSKINHTIVLKDNQATPSSTVGKRCETLTVINTDNQSRTMAFGLHANHVFYDGITEQVLEKGQSFIITLIQIGNFKIHDHEHEEVKATFQVR